MVRILLLILSASGAIACARQAAQSDQPVSIPRHVTLVGCVERSGGGEGGVIVRGRDVTGTSGTFTGAERGPSMATTLGTREEERRPARPLEDGVSLLTPRLESDNEADLSRRLGQRVLVRGDFQPADAHRAYDSVKVASIETVAPSCSQW
jgi:hypothetical protein